MGARHLDNYSMHYGYDWESRACMGCNPHGLLAGSPTCTSCDGSGWTQWAALADEPWTEVHTNLWLGGCDYTHAVTDGRRTWARAKVDADSGFDTVITLWDGWNPSTYGPEPDSGVEHHHLPFLDGPLTREALNTVARAAEVTLRDLSEGKSVLVRCQAGLNRSGLVVGTTLVNGVGLTGYDALSRMRAARSPWVMCNREFAEFLMLL
jgi:hypothetical protein